MRKRYDDWVYDWYDRVETGSFWVFATTTMMFCVMLLLSGIPEAWDLALLTTVLYLLTLALGFFIGAFRDDLDVTAKDDATDAAVKDDAPDDKFVE